MLRFRRGNSPSDLLVPPPDRTVISSAYLHRRQRRHFTLFDILPVIGTLFALTRLWGHPIGGEDVALFAVMWLLTGLGLTVGFHRLFSHRAFAAPAPVAALLLILGSMAARGPMISWASIHRRHHHLSDSDGDAHSPNLHGEGPGGRLRGWLHAHVTWLIRHDYPNPRHYVPDLLGAPGLVRINRLYYLWIMLGLILPAAIGAGLGRGMSGFVDGFLWGGVVRLFVVAQSMSGINSFLHLFGSRSFETAADNSRNSPWLGVLAWGEGWHNNHHAFPYSAAFGLKWFELDLGFWLIRSLEAAGLAWDVKLAKFPSGDGVVPHVS
jgi:stearoyl-CoA desaturase (delta-9 desaturase)